MNQIYHLSEETNQILSLICLKHSSKRFRPNSCQMNAIESGQLFEDVTEDVLRATRYDPKHKKT